MNSIVIIFQRISRFFVVNNITGARLAAHVELTAACRFSNLWHGKEIFRAIRGARRSRRFSVSSHANGEAD